MEQSWKEKTWKTRMSCLSFIGGKNSNKPKLTISNTQLNEDNQLVEEHPDVCDEESEERSELFFSVTSKWWRQKNKNKKKEPEHT